MQLKMRSIALLGGLLFAGSAAAAVSPEEAARLGQDLTPVGAEKAGNADGTIPEWSGELITPPPSFKPGDGKRPLPWPDEQPVVSITSANMGEHADKLTDGTKALLQQYGDAGYRVDVYPTHRSAGQAPQWFFDNTAYNATSATLEADGLKLANYRAGVPFPIPQSGVEVMWNHLVRWQGTHYEAQYDSYYMDKAGNPVLASTAVIANERPYYNPDKEYAVEDALAMVRIDFSAPARRAGEKQLIIDPTDFTRGGRKAWQYLKGQRRVRQAPTIAFDSPNPGNAGMATYDDGFLYNGSPERFDWKLLGKREVYIPFNANEVVFYASPEELLQPKFLNPDVVRWELHRVWVVEANLKEGERHIYQRRVYYIEEDSWTAVASEAYDVSGELWRVGYSYVAPLYDVPSVALISQGHYDLLTGTYYIAGVGSRYDGIKTEVEQKPARYFTAQGLSRSGIR
jgi:hypothetical protein